MFEDTKKSMPSHMNYGKFALEAFLKRKEKIALINGITGEQITFGELAQQIVNIAWALTRMGMKSGDVVAICSENRTEFWSTAIAIFCTGATATFINPICHKKDLIHALQISNPKLMFLSTDAYEKNYQTMKDSNIVHDFFIYGRAGADKKDRLISINDLTDKHVDVDSYEPLDFEGVVQTALILYSSGTTGSSKGVKISHSNLIAYGLQPLYYNGELTVLALTSWCNAVGGILTMQLLLRNQTIVYMAKFQEDLYLQCIQGFKVDILMAVPTLLVMLTKSNIIANYDVSSVKMVHCAGAPLGPLVINEVRKKFAGLKHILQGYGLTETTGVITQESETEHKEGSVGRSVTGITIKVVDVETNKKLGPNQAGEICVKGLTLFEGYIGKDLKDHLDDEGFYKTGDLAFYDEDGYFFIVDRLKELIKYKAGQVAPSELEALLLQHQEVKDVGVVGAPDALAGELPTAFVVKKSGSKVTEKELIDFVALHVSSWKQLRGGVKFVSEIPKTVSGKILRRLLRDSLTTKYE